MYTPPPAHGAFDTPAEGQSSAPCPESVRATALGAIQHSKDQLVCHLHSRSKDLVLQALDWLEGKAAALEGRRAITIDSASLQEIDQRVRQVLARITAREHHLQRQVETNQQVNEKLNYLAACMFRLRDDASCRLREVYSQGERLLSEGRRALDDVRFLDSEEREDAPARVWLDAPDGEEEIAACSKALALKIPLSSEALQQVAIGTFLRSTIQDYLVPLVCIAARRGHSTLPNLSFGDRTKSKMSCHFSDAPIPEVDIRRLFQRTDFKLIFKLIHLNDGRVPCIEAYAKIDRSIRSVSKSQFDLLQINLMKDAEISLILHAPTESKTPHASLASPDQETYLLKSRKVFHRKDPSRFKGVIMEFCDRSDLSTLPQPLLQGRPQQIRLATQLALALQHMHERHQCHLDVKPENAFLKSDREYYSIRLGDFEFTCEEGTVMNRLVGTLPFLSPEMLCSRVWIVSPSIDMWSFGLTLLEITHGPAANLFSVRASEEVRKMPYERIRQLWESIHHDIMASLSVSDPLDQLIAALLNFNSPSLRPSAKETVRRLVELAAIS